jgi:exonuclease SbcD
MRLSKAGIPTLLLVGNHDLSPAIGRAHAIEEFATLEVPGIRVLDKPCFLRPDELGGLPLQVIALPWVSRSALMANLGLSAADPSQVYNALEERLTELVHGWIEAADPELPLVLTAHASVQGATYGGERAVMLGGDLVLPAALVKDPRLDYVALGHIHKPQNLNEAAHPPVIYPGSIERVDFGEAKEDRFFIVVQVARGKTQVEWRKLEGVRPFVDRHLRVESADGITDHIREALPSPEALEGAIVRLVLEYPRELETAIDEAALREHTAAAFEFHLVKRPQMDLRVRLPDDQSVGSLTPLELLDIYWRATHTEDGEALGRLAAQVVEEVARGLEA